MQIMHFGYWQLHLSRCHNLNFYLEQNLHLLLANGYVLTTTINLECFTINFAITAVKFVAIVAITIVVVTVAAITIIAITAAMLDDSLHGCKKFICLNQPIVVLVKEQLQVASKSYFVVNWGYL